MSVDEAAMLSEALDELLKHAEGLCTLVIDQNGKCLARRGLTRTIDCDALAALVAGSFASTRAIAKMVGESEFTVLFHQGEKEHIHNSLVDDDTILTVLFDDRTTVGMVRLCSKEAAKKIRTILSQARCRTSEPPDEASSREAATETGHRIDDIFGKG
ncbi:MAG: roadblock/LC7 domain-containing protein [Candidatus Sumerlaeota bacterium]|nr:roadblock/LC7 domain-containing protein [Candidatus Sumerlaeota bacterium]